LPCRNGTRTIRMNIGSLVNDRFLIICGSAAGHWRAPDSLSSALVGPSVVEGPLVFLHQPLHRSLVQDQSSPPQPVAGYFMCYAPGMSCINLACIFAKHMVYVSIE
jgi:hypothetical protein